MRQTGDSWDIKADSGDLENWLPGGGKQRGQASLGADWPGKAVERPPTKSPRPGKGKRKEGPCRPRATSLAARPSVEAVGVSHNKGSELGIHLHGAHPSLAFVLFAWPGPPRPPPRNRHGRESSLLIITDQQTAVHSVAGNPYVKTPNLDRLAARGVRFEKSYCAYPLCCPSRGTLFTSRMPHELGIYGNFDAELSEKGVPTMGELFPAAGYETAYAGKWHLQVPFPAFKSRKIPGFTVLPLAGKDPHTIDLTKEGKGLTVDPNTADAAIEFLRQPHDQPFLLTVSVLNPHDICEYTKCEAFRQMLPDDPAQLPPARPNLRDTDAVALGAAEDSRHSTPTGASCSGASTCGSTTDWSRKPTPRWDACSRRSTRPGWTPRPSSCSPPITAR